jgi:chromosome segregation ATPase
MAERAHVTSVEALESFRASLIVYLSKARPALEEVNAEVVQTRLWLQGEQQTHWEREVARRGKRLGEAQQTLLSAGLSRLRDHTTEEQMAVNKAKRAMEEAEARLRAVKKWNREFDSRVDPLSRQLEKLLHTLINDLPQAIAWLGQAVKALDAYADVSPPPDAALPKLPVDPDGAGVSAESGADGKEGGGS